MKHLIKMGILAATLFTMALAPLSQAAAAGYGSYQGGGYYGHTYEGHGGYQVKHKKHYRHHRGYERGYHHRRPHRCETKRYRWSKSCRHYHRQHHHHRDHRDWRR